MLVKLQLKTLSDVLGERQFRKGEWARFTHWRCLQQDPTLMNTRIATSPSAGWRESRI